jgi:diguanylate cyclase (GGDEF)-like protein
VLKETAAAWRELLEHRGFLARYGGEEFTVLLPNTSADQAEIILDQLRETVSQGQTCSIGLTIWDGLEDPDQVVSRADEALYYAKRNGRNRVAVHDGHQIRDSIHQGSYPIDRVVPTGPEPVDALAPVV